SGRGCGCAESPRSDYPPSAGADFSLPLWGRAGWGPLGGFLRRLEVRVGARRVVRHIDDLSDLRDRRLDRHFDALAESDIDLGAALAAATQLNIRGRTAHLEQIDEAAMGCDRGIDLPVEHLLDASRDRIAPALVRIVDPKRPAQ